MKLNASSLCPAQKRYSFYDCNMLYVLQSYDLINKSIVSKYLLKGKPKQSFRFERIKKDVPFPVKLHGNTSKQLNESIFLSIV